MELKKQLPLIKQQQTSVAIFIGYTEKINTSKGEALSFVPKKVTSFTGFKKFFGQNYTTGFVAESIELFFENGGTECYVISVGVASNNISLDLLMQGLQVSNTVAGQLLIIPDACLLSPADFNTLQQAMLQTCATLQDRFAILNTQATTTSLDNDMQNFRLAVGSNNLQWGAAYYPWLMLANKKIVPPAGAVAGAYASIDKTSGVWKAPANISIKAIKDITVNISDSQQQNMNVDPSEGKSINSIRKFTGKGILIWGARTLAGNDNEWRYVSVKRFFINVEQSIKNGTTWATSQPNNATTWWQIKLQINDFLNNFWRQGALMGNKPEQAYFVRAGIGETMTQLDIDEGNLIIEFGMAVIQPAEFIIFRFTQKMILP